MTDTTMAFAFAEAKPASLPAIRLITRTRTGLRLWIPSQSLAGRRFSATAGPDNSLVVVEGPAGSRAINRNNQTEICFPAFGGPETRLEGPFKPTAVNGGLRWELQIPDLQVQTKHINTVVNHFRASTGTSRLVANTKPAKLAWTERQIRRVLEDVRQIETSTQWKIGRDKDGIAIFQALIV